MPSVYIKMKKMLNSMTKLIRNNLLQIKISQKMYR